MPYSPMVTPLQMPTRIPLVIAPENRNNSTDKDSRLVNCFVEITPEKDMNIYRRPGLLQYQVPPATTAAGMGMYYWGDDVYSIFDGVLYKNGASVATGLDTTEGVYSFYSIMGATPKLTFQNGKAFYSYEPIGGLKGPIHGIDENCPQYTCKGIAYLNGATYLLQHFFGTNITPAVIWGSTINSVDVNGDWDPLDFITAQIEPDSGVYLAKQLVYVVCIKEWSTEIFFDAGNATGSPLQNMQNNKLPYGCASQDSVQSIDDSLFWISTSKSASNQVMMLKNLVTNIISTAAIEKLLQEADLSVVYSWQVKTNGHSFYVLTIKNANLTIAYDINQNQWCQWTDLNGDYLPIVASCRNQAGDYFVQHETNGTIYYIGPNYLTDNGDIIPVEIITPPMSFHTQRYKYMGMMTFLGDQVPGSIMYVQVSDDDYQTWSQPRMIDMGMNLPNLPNCGRFRTRALKLTLNNAMPWRLSAVEAQYSVGVL